MSEPKTAVPANDAEVSAACDWGCGKPRGTCECAEASVQNLANLFANATGMTFKDSVQAFEQMNMVVKMLMAVRTQLTAKKP